MTRRGGDLKISSLFKCVILFFLKKKKKNRKGSNSNPTRTVFFCLLAEGSN